MQHWAEPVDGGLKLQVAFTVTPVNMGKNDRSPLNAKILADSFFLWSIYSVTSEVKFSLQVSLDVGRAVRSSGSDIPSSAQPWKSGIYIVPFCVKIHSPSGLFWGKQLFLLQASALGFCY